MTDTTEKLLPCPFCGRVGEGYQCHESDMHFVECTNKKCPVQPHTDWFETESEAIAAWNRRVAEKPKWTKETPTETGWYCVFNHWAPSMMQSAWVFKKDDKWWATINGQEPYRVEYLRSHLQWLKIDIPALPEEGGETQ